MPTPQLNGIHKRRLTYKTSHFLAPHCGVQTKLLALLIEAQSVPMPVTLTQLFLQT